MDLLRGVMKTRALPPKNGWMQREPTGEYTLTVTRQESASQGVCWTYSFPQERQHFVDDMAQNVWGLNEDDLQMIRDLYYVPA
jgi:hypothetical protein